MSQLAHIICANWHILICDLSLNLNLFSAFSVHFRCTKNCFPGTIPCRCPTISNFAQIFPIASQKILILPNF